MPFEDIFEVRDARPNDLAFIYATWLRGLRFGCDWWRESEPASYFKNYHDFIEGLLNRPGVHIKVAAMKDDPDTFVSYAVYQDLPNGKSTLHWVFTKKAWRNQGMMKRLVPDTIKQCSHLTTVGLAIKPADWIFNPFEM